MPIVTIHAAPPSDVSSITKMISDVRIAGAKVLECDTSNIWVSFQPERTEYYLQNVIDHPPVVYIMANRGRAHDKKGLFVRAITEAVGTALSVRQTRYGFTIKNSIPRIFGLMAIGQHDQKKKFNLIGRDYET